MCEKRKILLITASVSEQSLSTDIAERFVADACASGEGGICEKMDLCNEDIPRMTSELVRAFGDGTIVEVCPKALEYVEKFLNADIYVFALPNYNKLTSADVVSLLNLLSLDERI